MKFKQVLRSSHDLKKNGYKILDKLHKLEKKKNLSVYSNCCDEGAFVLISVKQLAELLKMTTLNSEQQVVIQAFISRTDNFLMHFTHIVDNNSRMNPSILSSYLKAYTSFFNNIIENRTKLSFTSTTDVQWTAKCVLAYYAAWGVNKWRFI